MIFCYHKKPSTRTVEIRLGSIVKLTTIFLNSFGRFVKIFSVKTLLSIVHQVQSLKYSKCSEISVSLFYVLIRIPGFMYFVLMVSFQNRFYVYKGLFVMDPMKSWFQFFQLSQRQKNNGRKTNLDYRGN